MEPYLSFLDIFCFLYRGTWKNPHFHTWEINLKWTKKVLKKEKQFKMVQHVWEWRMYGGWGELSLCDAAGNLKLSAWAEVRHKQHWRWVRKSHLCFWISVTYIPIKPQVFLSTPTCLLIAWTLDPPRHQGIQAHGHSPSSSKRSPMCPCASASFFPPSILISSAISKHRL